MKKISFVVFALALCIMVTGCFASNKTEQTPEVTAPTTVANTATTAITTGGTTLATVAVTTVPSDITEFPCAGYATDSLNVRRTPNLDYDAVGGLNEGDQVTIVGKEGDFYKIEWNSFDGNYGEKYAYVSAQYISKSKAAPTIPTATTATIATTVATNATNQ